MNNWQEIKEKHPKAFQEFRIKEKQIEADHGPEMDLFRVTDRYNRDYRPRDLYDHFDGLGIVMIIDVSWDDDDKMVRYPVIYTDDNINYGYKEGDIVSTNRTDAEAQGFEKLFEIREKQLTEGEQQNK